MEKSVIYGAGIFSKLILEHLRWAGLEPVAVVVDQEFLGGRERFCDLPLVAAEDMTEKFPPTEYGVYITMGYREMNRGRQLVFGRLEAAGYQILSFIHPTARIEAETVGRGIIALQNVVIDRFCQLGEGNIFQIGVLIAHHTVLGSFNFFAPGACVAGNTHIGDNCFLGANCTVRNGVNVGDRTLVGAAAYLDRDTESGAVFLPTRSAILAGRDSLEMKL